VIHPTATPFIKMIYKPIWTHPWGILGQPFKVTDQLQITHNLAHNFMHQAVNICITLANFMPGSTMI